MYRKYPKPERLWHWEEVALILFTLTIPMQNLGIVKEFTIAQLFALVGYLYFMIRAIARRDMWILLLPFRSPIILSILFLVFVNMISGFNMMDTQNYVGFIQRLLSLLNVVIFYAYIMKRNRYLLYALIGALIVGSFPNAVAGLYELATKKMVLKFIAQGTEVGQALFGSTSELPGTAGGRRILGFDGGPGEHAIHFVVYAALSAMLPFLARNFWVKILAGFLVLINIVNVMGTGSRTGMIGLFLAMACFFIFIEVRRKAAILAAVLVAGTISIFAFDVPLARLLGKTATTHVTQNFRIEQYRTALNMVEKHPFLGIGAGNFIPEYSRYQWNYPRHDEWYSITPLHNAILNQFAEGGLIGLFALFVLLSVVMFKLYLIRAHSPDRTLRIIAVSFMSAFIGWCGGLLFYPSLADEQGWIIMGMTIGLWNVHRQVLEDRGEAEGVEETVETVGWVREQ